MLPLQCLLLISSMGQIYRLVQTALLIGAIQHEVK